MTKDKKIRKICRYSYTRQTNGLPQDGQRLCRQLENEARISLIQYLDASNWTLSLINKCDVESSLDDFKKERIRDQRDKEDRLLNSRTTIFLATNALLITATQISKGDPETRIGIILLGLIITTLWFLCSFQCWKVLKVLNKLQSKKLTDEIDEKIARVLFSEAFRPNSLLAVWLPILVFLSWGIYLVSIQLTKVCC